MSRVLLESAPRDRESIVVLYHLPDDVATPYVTWIAAKDNPKATFWGHYFETREDAEEDFDIRSFGGREASNLHYVMRRLGASCGEYTDMLKEFRGS